MLQAEIVFVGVPVGRHGSSRSSVGLTPSTLAARAVRSCAPPVTTAGRDDRPKVSIVPDTAEEPEVADELYAVRPDEFVPERDEAVVRAREAGDRELARAIGKLRRPTRAAWLANLLARERPDQLEGLLGLATGLADAQRTLDGSALRALSAQRHRLVTAVAAEAGAAGRGPARAGR